MNSTWRFAVFILLSRSHFSQIELVWIWGISAGYAFINHNLKHCNACTVYICTWFVNQVVYLSPCVLEHACTNVRGLSARCPVFPSFLSLSICQSIKFYNVHHNASLSKSHTPYVTNQLQTVRPNKLLCSVTGLDLQIYDNNEHL